MKRIPTIVYSVLVFSAGSLTSSVFEWLQPLATTEITNASGKTITRLSVHHTGFGDRAGSIAENVAPGAKVIFKWATEGESNYQLVATFEDGTEVKGGLGYTERGESVKDAVFADHIMSQSPLMLTFKLLHDSPHDTTYRAEPASRFRQKATPSGERAGIQ